MLEHFVHQQLENNSFVYITDIILSQFSQVKLTNFTSKDDDVIIDSLLFFQFYQKLLKNLHLVGLLLLSILTNGFLLRLNHERKHNQKPIRLSIFLAHLGFVNICLSVGLISTIFLSEFLGANMDQPSYSKLNDVGFGAIREFVGYLLTQKFAYLQSYFLFSISIERYLLLFPSYSPHFESSRCFYFYFILLYLIFLIIFDHRILSAISGFVEATVACLVILILPTLLAFAFTTSTLVYIRCHRKIFYQTRDTSVILVLLILLTLQCFGQFLMVLELVHYNFSFDYVIGNSQHSSDGLQVVLNVFYQIGHYLFILSPLYISSLFLIFVREQRNAAVASLTHLVQTLACLRTTDKVDYNSETMRSIIAEQTRRKPLRLYSSPAGS